MTPQEIAALAQIQRRASIEDRTHLVALVEHAWGGPAASAERLVPGGVRVDSTRLDCEKPIRDENGKFLGCEAGGGGGSTEGSPSASNSPSPTSTPFDGDREARQASKLKRQQAELDRHTASGDTSKEAKDVLYRRVRAIESDEDPDEAEKKYRSRPLAPSPDDSPRVALAKANREEMRSLQPHWSTKDHDEADVDAIAAAKAIDDAVARKLVKEPISVGAKDIVEIRKASVGYDELQKQHEIAAQALADLHSLNNHDERDEKLYIEPGDMDFDSALSEASEAAGAEHRFMNVREADSDYEVPEPPNPDDDPDEDSFEDPEDYPVAKAEYDKSVKDYETAKAAHDAKVKEKAVEVADALEKTHELQLATIAKMKEAKKVSASKLRALKKEGSDPEELVDAKLRKAAEKAQEELDGDGEMTDGEVAAAEKIVADYDQATSAAEQLASDHEEAIDEVSEDSSFESAIDILVETAKETKKAAAKLRKGLGQKPKASKPKAAKRPAAKARAKPDPDDEEEDADEDDEDDADEE